MAAPEASTIVGRFASRLRFPQLFTVTAILFLIDLAIPDLVPFADEIMLGLLTALFGSLKKPQAEESAERPPIKDVTPR